MLQPLYFHELYNRRKHCKRYMRYLQSFGNLIFNLVNAEILSTVNIVQIALMCLNPIVNASFPQKNFPSQDSQSKKCAKINALFWKQRQNAAKQSTRDWSTTVSRQQRNEEIFCSWLHAAAIRCCVFFSKSAVELRMAELFVYDFRPTWSYG